SPSHDATCAMPHSDANCARIGRVAKQTPAGSWNNYTRELGARLHRLRVDRGFSQERLAYAAGITRYTYQKLEKGESVPGSAANPSLRNIMAIAQQLGVSLDELLPTPWPALGE